MKRSLALLGLAIFGGWFALGSFAMTAKTRVLLYDVKLEKTEEKLPLLPTRVYVVYDEGQKTWVYVLSDEKAHLADPREVLLAGSRIPASALGSPDPAVAFYELDLDGKWLPTQRSELLNFAVLGPNPGDLPLLKTVSSENVPGPNPLAPPALPPSVRP